MISPKLSFITTIYNEEKTIEKFLDSLFLQTKKVDEIIIVDGGSTDTTVEKIKFQAPRFKKKNISFNFFVKKGNRSVGRNEAIKHTSGDIILCSDAGNILDKKWVENIIKPFSDQSVDVVAGYYKGKASNIFQKCLIPYILVMPDKVDESTFLPATRSVAFTKAIWKKVGKFPEEFSHNEDYVFANKLKEKKANIIFARDAIVYWIPRNTWKQVFIMFFRFAYGDTESSIIRTNVLLLFARYFLGVYLIFLTILYKSLFGMLLLICSILVYGIWSIVKNYRYVKKNKALYLLPCMQIVADAAVISGTLIAFTHEILRYKYISYAKRNMFLFLIVAIYSFLMILTIHSGAPNSNHPYPYNMDEWHQLQAVRETFIKGTPNTAGAANGTMFHFFLSGLYLMPFVLSKYISVTNMTVFDLEMRSKVFEVLRFSTILWGVLSLFMLNKIIDLTGAAKKTTLFLFTFCPLWLSLSGYFKYDIGLMFWLLTAVYALIYFAKNPTNRNFIIAAIPSALSFAVKVSAIPLFPIFIISFFWFHPTWKQNIKYLFIGIFIYLSITIVFGMPDTLFGKGNIIDYLINNILQTPTTTDNITFGINPWVYLFVRHYPIIFGPGLIVTFIISLYVILYNTLKEGLKKHSIDLFLVVMCIAFIASILPLQILGGGNRSLVMLPFFALISGIGINVLIKRKKNIVLVTGLILLVFFTQAYYSVAVVYLKSIPSPQENSSYWLTKHIQHRAMIGLENIPIYQNIPDLIQKEFYFTQSKGGKNNIFNYVVIDSKSIKLPPVVVITNDNIEEKYIKASPKKDLITRLKKENYVVVARFYPDIRFLGLNDLDYSFSTLIPSPYVTSVYIK